MSLRRVVVLGATGNVGRPIVAALASAGFEVTAASRSAGADLPSSIRTVAVDYQNHKQLVDLFSEHDTVIEAFNPSAAALQPAIINAALEAGIKHLITPDFACDTFNKDAADLRIYDPKIEAQKELEKRVKGRDMKWTAIITGGWFDWGMRYPRFHYQKTNLQGAIPIGLFWIQPATHTVMVYGSGDQRYSMCRVSTTGQAIVEVLNNPHKYANRPVYIADYTVSTNEIIPLLEEIRPGWNIQKMEVAGLMEQAKKLWDEDTKKGVVNRLATPAYAMLGTAGLFDENNKYGADHSHKAEMGFDKGLDELKEELRVLVAAEQVQEGSDG